MSLIVAYIDGTRFVFESENTRELDGGGIEIEPENPEEGGQEFVLFENREQAGEAAKERWEDMAEHDPEELRTLVGDGVLISWALGQHAGPGTEGAHSLREWLDEVIARHPEEEFASYDHEERDFECNHPDFADYTVAYRSN